MTAYTKGPWKLRSEGSVCVVDGSGNAISYSDTFLPNEQCLANARIQAAAPELLEALKLAVESASPYIRTYHRPGVGCTELVQEATYEPWVDAARVAIAKAEGL